MKESEIENQEVMNSTKILQEVIRLWQSMWLDNLLEKEEASKGMEKYLLLILLVVRGWNNQNLKDKWRNKQQISTNLCLPLEKLSRLCQIKR